MTIARTRTSLLSVFLWLLLLSNSLSNTHAQERHEHVCDADRDCLNEAKCKLVHHDGNHGSGGGDDGNIYLHRHCVCPPEFGGSRCEKFCPLECLNGGYCRFDGDTARIHQLQFYDTDLDDYMCKCMGYFTGTLCEIPYENCLEGRQCFHGGRCQDEDQDEDTSGKSNKNTVCACPEGFNGPSCEVDLSKIQVGESSSPARGPVLTGVLVPMIAVAALIAALVHRRRRKNSALDKTPEHVEFVPRGSGHQRWLNVI
jgi:hypothetical protein